MITFVALVVLQLVNTSMPNYCICIPSRGRPSGASFKLLKEINFPSDRVRVFVEPTQVDAYKGLGFPIEVLPACDQGVGFARNYIVQWASKAEYKYIYMLDDDINLIAKHDTATGKYPRVKDAIVFDACVNIAETYGLSLVGLIHVFNLRFGKLPRFFFKSWAVSFVVLNVEHALAIGNYTADLPLNEDADFNLRLWKSGFKTALITDYAHSKSNTSVGKDVDEGCAIFYNSVHKECHEYMMSAHPGCFRMVEKKGVLKLFAKWKAIHEMLADKKLFDWGTNV